MNVKIAAILVLCAMPAFGQEKTKADKPAPAAADVKPVPPADIVTPKESIATLKLQLAMEKERSIQGQAQSLQQQAMQAIEPRLQPLRADYAAELKKAKDQEDLVRKENGYGPDIIFDEALGSPTFGQWMKKKTTEEKK